jgi:aminobenzoyl-glutamate transport protein
LNSERRSLFERALSTIERAGNALPDPALLFAILMIVVWIFSKLLAPVEFEVIDPRTQKPLVVLDQLTGPALAAFLAGMVTTFTSFPPLGLVLVALLGVGVAEHTGLIRAAIRSLLSVTPKRLLTPALITVAILSHATGDAGFVVVIPLGGVIYQAAGRHPLAGLAAAFAGVSGAFGAALVPGGLEPLLQGITQSAVHILDPKRDVNPLCNWTFTAASSLLIIGLGWLLTDRFVEPRLAKTKVDDAAEAGKFEPLTSTERTALSVALGALLLFGALIAWAAWPADSPLRAPNGELTAFSAPLMKSIVPIIFLGFLIPGAAYGYVSGSVKSHRDLVKGMSETMSTMGYYIVMAFFAALFIGAFTQSNLGVLLALEGADVLRALDVPRQLTIFGFVSIVASVNLLIGSASAKWALLSPVFVPMLMQIGLSPELIQAAYRIGDSSTNIVTPLMPYFPLVVVYCQKYVRATGVGTLVALMLPYTIVFLLSWFVFLLVYWGLGLPLGVAATYTYP